MLSDTNVCVVLTDCRGPAAHREDPDCVKRPAQSPQGGAEDPLGRAEDALRYFRQITLDSQ